MKHTPGYERLKSIDEERIRVVTVSIRGEDAALRLL